MRDIVLLIASLAGAAVLTALAILIRPESPLWKALLWGGIAVFVACACVLLFDYFKPDSRPIFLIGAATGIALFFGFGIALILDSRSLVPQGSKPIQIVFRNEAPFVTVAPAGVNRRRMIRVRIDNNTDKAISNGRLDVSDLDPPYRDHPNWLLKDAISVAPHDHTFVEVVYYDEGSSQAKPGTIMRLAVPIGGGFFAEAYPSLPLTPHTFFLKFSTLERGLSDEMYCKIYVASDHVLHFENRGDLTPQKQSLQIPLRDPYDQNLRWALEQIAASTVFTGEIDAAPDELRQAARNGTVTIYGRPNSGHLAADGFYKPIEPIKPDHWRDFGFDVLRCLFHDDLRECRTEPDDSRALTHNETYVDLRVNSNEVQQKWPV